MEKRGFHRWTWLIVLLLGGLLILYGGAQDVLNLVWGWRLRRAEDDQELARRVALVSMVGMIADWVSGYYGFGSLMALLVGVWLMMKYPNA